MKKIQLSVVVVIVLISLNLLQASAQEIPKINILPVPVDVQRGNGVYSFNSLNVSFPQVTGIESLKTQFRQRILNNIGWGVSASKTNPNVTFLLNKKTEAMLGKEGYRLVVNGKGIVVSANEPAGLFYGMQSLFQLLPLSNEIMKLENISVPFVSIVDYPRFAWRGLMLDVARHFFTKAEVKSYIDQMAKYKFNLFHWHLTDDEGWRIQIKGLPKLTEVGAWNVHKVGYFGTFSPVSDTDKYNYGGFYTQDDIKEVVQYAKDRYVDILPEVDVPGHSMAAVASYPELSCTPGADKYKVRSGQAGFMDWTDSGIVAHYDNTLCPANPKVYAFLDKVFGEVAALFPFAYIHIGGDECAKTFWKTNPEIQALMKQENIKTMEEV